MAGQTATLEFPRQYVAVEADFGRWEAAEPYFRELHGREVSSLEQLDKWLIDWSELVACLGEEGTRRQIAMTCQTDDPARQQAYLEFIQTIIPNAEPWNDKLNRRFVEHAGKLALPRKRYEVLERSVRNTIELYREENIPLNVQDEELSTQYQQITGIMSCEYDGRQQTLEQMALYLEETDRPVREQAWRLITDRYLQDAEQIDALYEKMVALRHKIARNAGFDDYRAFSFRAKERFDYAPEDCLAFHDAIERVVLPAVKVLADRRREKLGLATLRPWDLEVDPDQRPPLRPFKTGDELAAGCSRVFEAVDPELGRIFETLRDRKSLDLDTRQGKAPGGYQATYQERRLPFIFMNAAGTEQDVRTLLHEGGHAFHTWACRNEPLIAYRTAPIEFCEVASMGMECLSLPYTDVFFGPDANRATKRFFEKILTLFPFIASIDAFQHHVYTHVDEGREGWKDHWQAITRRFSPEIDKSGLERQDRHSWHRKLHIFQVPFYYIEYGIAQLGALQVWRNSTQDYPQAVAQYRRGLSLGGARPLPELFEAAGCEFDFTEKTLRPLVDAIMEKIDSL